MGFGFSGDSGSPVGVRKSALIQFLYVREPCIKHVLESTMGKMRHLIAAMLILYVYKLHEIRIRNLHPTL